ncbi:polysaccharide deacetylase family protein [Paenibacillus aurantiacus]|uniref:Polysaccharide deacetylase family protein n=1 Tax=Paenibacillus aurantiacus TaxID=1936118 RepID=A0ABV5KS01_9BACL
MKRITNLWPGGRLKALTLSYDDGVEQDRSLVEIFNKYNLKATFNINSGIQSESSIWNDKGVTIRRMNAFGLEELYDGHEVAVHTLTHPSLVDIPHELVLKEIIEDKKRHEEQFGYLVRGMAYPFGTYNDDVIEVVKFCGIEYARTVNQHEQFTLPDNYYKWHPTCHHINPKLMDLTQAYIQKVGGPLSLIFVWGHSYEFAVDNNWELIEEFSKQIGNRSEIWYATNIQVVDYLKAQRRLKYSTDCSMVYNESSLSIWISVDDQAHEVMPGRTVLL